MQTTIRKIIKNPRIMLTHLLKMKWSRIIPDELYLKTLYRIVMGETLDLKNPKTFNEKIQWLKLHDKNPLYVSLVDKYEAKKWIASKIGDEYIIPTFGVWNCVEEITFDQLPDQYVLKCTHDSGSVFICKNKKEFRTSKVKRRITHSLTKNYFYLYREWPYKNVRPRIIAEKFLSNPNVDNELIDYKLMCFNGEVKVSFVCNERFSKSGLCVTFFSTKWERLPFYRHYHTSNKIFDKPASYDKMVELAQTLAKDIPFVRVDFFEINGKPYVGELTFYPGSGLEEFVPAEWDRVFGDWLVLPQVSDTDK